MDITEKLYAKLNGIWVDITSNRVTELVETALTVKRGFLTNQEDDRLSDVGTLSFWLNNSTGLWDPSLSTVTEGWNIGVKIVLKYTFEGKDYVRFYGTVKNIVPDDIVWSAESTVSFVKVTVLDWMRNAYQRSLTNTIIQTNNTGDVAISTLLTNDITEQPLAKSLDVGVNAFDALFDTATPKTKVATEFNKIALSEIGYIYTKSDTDLGETLVFENANHRNGLNTLSKIPVDNENSGFLLKGDGGFLLKEDGGKLILDVSEDATFGTANFKSLNRDYGANIINDAKVIAYPKKADASPVVLYEITTPFTIAPGQTKTFDGEYKRPNTGETITVYDSLMIQPVGTTDYTMNTNKYGTGTDLTADHTVSVVYGSNKPTVTIVNNSVYYSAVTKFQCRGQGVYQSDEIVAKASDTTSQENYDVSEFSMSQVMQSDIERGQQFADRIVYFEKDPRNKVNKINMVANRSTKNMYAFLTLDIGDLISLTDTSKNISSWYYIQGISFTVLSGTIIEFSWIVKEHYSEDAGNLTPVEIETVHLHKDVIVFDNIEQLSNQDYLSLIIDFTKDTAGIILSKAAWEIADGGAYISGFYVYTNGALLMFAFMDEQFKYLGYLSSYFTEEAFVRIGISFNRITESIKFYYGGSPVTPVTFTKTTALEDYVLGYFNDIGNRIIINGVSLLEDGVCEYGYGCGGTIGRIKLFNVELTEDEFSKNNSGTEPATRGLQFEAPFIKTSDIAHYTYLTMTANDKVIDNMHGIVGTPSGSPVCRI
ncbi:MAG: hypothetical protein WC428_06705 [Candidatus Paceibacterota bacterium]